MDLFITLINWVVVCGIALIAAFAVYIISAQFNLDWDFCGILFVCGVVISLLIVPVTSKQFDHKINEAVKNGYIFYVDGQETDPQDIPKGTYTMQKIMIYDETHEVHIATWPKQNWTNRAKPDKIYVNGTEVDRDHVSLWLYEPDQIYFDKKTNTAYITTGKPNLS